MKIENLMPPSIPIRIKSGVDRYGFSRILARRINLRYVPRSFANWVHGWVWCTDDMAVQIACSDLPKDLSIVVNNEGDRLVLVAEGFLNVRCGGLPFAYVAKQHDFRHDDALLVIPPHSSEPLLGKLTATQEDYFDYIESIMKDFDYVYVSIHQLDINTPLHYAALSRGLKVIQGAAPSDANGLIRVRTLLDGFKYVTSNVMGSHMLYALYAGCHFSFAGSFFSYPHSELIGTEKDTRQRYSRFFCQHPRRGLRDIEFAVKSIGEKYILQSHEIIDALGWSVAGQVSGYSKVFQRKWRGI